MTAPPLAADPLAWQSEILWDRACAAAEGEREFRRAEILLPLIDAALAASAESGSDPAPSLARIGLELFGINDSTSGPERVELLRALLGRGFDPDSRDEEGWTVLHQQACYGNRDLCLALLSAGADPGLLTPNGADARSFAVDAGHDLLVAEFDEFAVASVCAAPSAPPRRPRV